MTLTRRVLRSCDRRARVMHYCANCDNQIFPGDIYYILVEIRTVGTHKWLEVRKEHVHPSCPYDPEDEPSEYTFYNSNVYEFRLAA